MQSYPDCYVASVSLEANYNQVVKAMAEAEAHHGPSLIIAYSPCAMHGIANMGASASNAKLAVDSGYWPLYRYRPGNTAGDGQLVLDSKKIKGELEEFLKLENRFMVLARKDPETAKALHDLMDTDIKLRHERLVAMSKKPVVEGEQA